MYGGTMATMVDFESVELVITIGSSGDGRISISALFFGLPRGYQNPYFEGKHPNLWRL